MYLGDFVAGQGAVDVLFSTFGLSGEAAALVGGSVRVYRANSLTQITAGVALSANHDGLTGLNHVRVDLTNAAYTAGATYAIVLDAGTVDSLSQAGLVLGTFSVANRTPDVAAILAALTLVRGNAVPASDAYDPTTKKLRLVRGDDYPDGEGGLPPFTSEAWPDLTGATAVTLTIRAAVGDGVIVAVPDTTASRVVGTGEQAVLFEPMSEDNADVAQTGSTNALPIGANTIKWDIQATLASGHVKTLASGRGDVDEDQTRVS